MGCESCSNNKEGGLPKGCKNNGSCGSSVGCNKLEVYDWLTDMELAVGQKIFDIVEIRFKNSRKLFCKNTNNISLNVGDAVIVEGNPGYDVGVVSIVGELVRLQLNKKCPDYDSQELKKIYRKATTEDINTWVEARSLEKDAMFKARTMAVSLGLEMKLSDVEYQGDKTKATFFYTADGRVDFRELIKVLASEFRVRIEMRQIGARQEAARLGGIGSCGRELCCSTWLNDFRTVSTSAARYQQLALNPQKLAGQCGKLKCCLNYELDMYVEAFADVPDSNTRLNTEKGAAVHQKTDLFKKIMWYTYLGDNGYPTGNFIPLKMDRVREIVELNKQGKKPTDLVDFVEAVEVIEEPDYTNVVGQDSLTRFDNLFKKKKRPKKKAPVARNTSSNATKGEAQKNNQDRTKNPKNRTQQTKEEADKPKNQPRPRKVQNTTKEQDKEGAKPKPSNNRNNKRPSRPSNKEGGNTPTPQRGPKNNPKSNPDAK